MTPRRPWPPNEGFARVAIRGPTPSPPILFVDEDGDPGLLYPSLEALASDLEWPEQYDEPAEAYDAGGRHIVLTSDSEDGPVRATVSQATTPERVEALLRPLVRDRPMRFGLLDADVPIDGLLRAFWRLERRKTPYPRDIERH